MHASRRDHGRSSQNSGGMPVPIRPAPCGEWKHDVVVAARLTGLKAVFCVFAFVLMGCQGISPGDDVPTADSDRPALADEIQVFKRPSPLIDDDGQRLSIREGLRRDAVDFWPMVGNDARQIVNGRNAAILGAALGGSLIIREELDDDVRRDTAKHPQRWGDTSEFLGYLGNAEAQVPVLLAIHTASLMSEDEPLHDLTTTMMSAYAINGLSTLAIKGIANTERPSDTWNNGDYGFPSFHMSSSMTMATVLDEYYGPSVSVPAYALAGLIGWSRIDQRDHDLSDVVFGAAMGYVIGKTVARHHLEDGSQISVMPSVDPTSGSVELLVEVPY